MKVRSIELRGASWSNSYFEFLYITQCIYYHSNVKLSHFGFRCISRLAATNLKRVK